MLDGVQHLGLFVIAGLMLNLTPGPDVLYIVQSGMRHGWRGGLVAALGITAGCCVHIVAAAVGVSALVAASATAFTVLKWIGAAYLLYIGTRMLLSRAPATKLVLDAAPEAATGASGRVLRTVFRQAFWTNALNPKVALFFLAFLPQFIAPGAEHTSLTFLLLGVIFNVNAMPINLGYGLGAAWLAQRLHGMRHAMRWLDRAAGALFIFFGIRLAMSERLPN